MIYVQVNMKMMTKVTILSLSIIVLLSRNACSIYQESENHIKSATFLSEKFEVGPRKIALKTFLDIDFPKGYIGVKSFVVPLYEAYLLSLVCCKIY